MIGEADGILKTFTIAIVSNLTILDEKFNAEKAELIDLLNEVVGVSFNKDIKQEFIILKIDNSQKEYIKTTHSQESRNYRGTQRLFYTSIICR